MSHGRMRILTAALALGLVLPTCHLPAAARVESYPVGSAEISFGSVEFEVPEGWSARLQASGSESGAAVKFEPPGAKPFMLLVTPLPLTKPAEVGGRCERLRATAEGTRRRLAAVAEESDVPLRKLQGSVACGYFASASDRTVKTPTTEDFKYATRGLAATGHAMLSFTVLTNLEEAPEVKAALEIVGSARHVGVPESATSAMAALRLAFPGKPWGLFVDLEGFELEAAGEPADRVGTQILAYRADTGIRISIYLEQATRSDTARGYRQWYRENHLPPIQGAAPFDVAESQRNAIPILEHSRVLKGITTRHMNGFLVHDGVWIDVHVSKVEFAPADRVLFDRVFDSVRLEPASSSVASVVTSTDGSVDTLHGSGVHLPGRSWAVHMDFRGFKKDQAPPGPPGGLNVGFQRAQGAMRLTLTLQPAPLTLTGSAARAFTQRLLPGAPYGIKSVREFESGDFFYLTYNSHSDGTGSAVSRRHGHAFRVYDGYLIEVMLSQWDLAGADERSFEELLRSVRVLPRE